MTDKNLDHLAFCEVEVTSHNRSTARSRIASFSGRSVGSDPIGRCGWNGPELNTVRHGHFGSRATIGSVALRLAWSLVPRLSTICKGEGSDLHLTTGRTAIVVSSVVVVALFGSFNLAVTANGLAGAVDTISGAKFTTATAVGVVCFGVDTFVGAERLTCRTAAFSSVANLTCRTLNPTTATVVRVRVQVYANVVALGGSSGAEVFTLALYTDLASLTGLPTATAM